MLAKVISLTKFNEHMETGPAMIDRPAEEIEQALENYYKEFRIFTKQSKVEGKMLRVFFLLYYGGHGESILKTNKSVSQYF